MTVRGDDFQPGLTSEEHGELLRMARRMESERAVPAAAFRGDLRRRLVASEGTSRRRGTLFGTRRLASRALAAGVALLVVAAAGLADLGPLAPGGPAPAIAELTSGLH